MIDEKSEDCWKSEKLKPTNIKKFLNSNKGNLGKTSTISLFGKLIEKKS